MAGQGFVEPSIHSTMLPDERTNPQSASGSSPGNSHYRATPLNHSNNSNHNYDTATTATTMSINSPYQQSHSSQPSESKQDRADPLDQGEHAPSWAELKTKAGKDRKRLPLACIACRRKKIRCSGEKPACKHCLKARIPCVYKVTTRKAAPRTDYMAMLDKRLKRMEDRVIKIIPKEDLPDIARAVVKPTPANAPTKSRFSKKRSANDAFGNDLESWAERPANAEPGPSSAPKPGNTGEENSLLTEGAHHLPSKQIQEHLAEVYFDYVYGQSYPLLHKPSFMRKLEAGTVAPVLLLAVCAISARFSTHPLLQSEPAFLRGDRWAQPALEIALKRFDSPNITILIVYLLLGTHEFATCQGGRSWMLGGMAHRMAYALQLHRDLDSEPQGQQRGNAPLLSDTDREIRRRTMWSCFMMDRFNSSGTQRPMFANEQNLHLQLPIKESLFQQEVPGPTEGLDGEVTRPGVPGLGQVTNARANMGVAAYTVRLVALWGSLIQYLNLGGRDKDEFPTWSPKSTHRKLRDRLDAFRTALPDELKYTEENLLIHAAEGLANQFLYMHIAYYHCVLFVNRFSFPTTAQVGVPKDMPSDFLQEAKSKAIDAASDISKLIEEATAYRVTAPYAGYCAVTSSAVHIHNIFASHNAQLEASAKKHLATNISYLNKMKKYWGYFQFLTENLKDVYRQYAEGASTPTTRGKQVWQYGDWYDRYPHGVSKMELDEPRSSVKREEGDDAVLSQKPGVQSVEQYIEAMSPSTKAKQPSLAGKNNTKPAKKSRPPKKGDTAGVSGAENNAVDAMRDRSIDGMDLSRNPFGPPESYDRSPINTQIANSLLPDPQIAGSLPGDLAGSQTAPMFPFGPPPQTGIMPQLDRHMVLASYNGISPSATQDMAAPFWDMEFPFLGDDFSAEASNAWFMPFNMNPPLTDFGTGNDFGMGGGLGGFPSDLWMTPPMNDQGGNADMGAGQ